MYVLQMFEINKINYYIRLLALHMSTFDGRIVGAMMDISPRLTLHVMGDAMTQGSGITDWWYLYFRLPSDTCLRGR